MKPGGTCEKLDPPSCCMKDPPNGLIKDGFPDGTIWEEESNDVND